jgi:hypothetical protein
MGKGSSFKELQLGHAGINPSEKVADSGTWHRYYAGGPAEPLGNFRQRLAPWAARRPATPQEDAAIEEVKPLAIHTEPPAPAHSARVHDEQLPPINLCELSASEILGELKGRARAHNFLGFYGNWESKFKRLLCDTLDSPEIREAIANRETLPQTLPVLLGDMLLRRAVDTNHKKPFGGGTIHDFMLNDEGDAGYVLKPKVANAVEQFARDCVGAPARTRPQTKVTQYHLTPNTLAARNLRDIDTREAYIQHCIAYANHTVLPDNAENPNRTLAFRAALKHAIANIDGIATIDLRHNPERMRIAGKLVHGVRGSALHHLRKGDAPELDYKGLLDDNSKLSTDAFTSINQFVNFTACEFLNERGISKSNGAAQRG